MKCAKGTKSFNACINCGTDQHTANAQGIAACGALAVETRAIEDGWATTMFARAAFSYAFHDPPLGLPFRLHDMEERTKRTLTYIITRVADGGLPAVVEAIHPCLSVSC